MNKNRKLKIIIFFLFCVFIFWTFYSGKIYIIQQKEKATIQNFRDEQCNTTESVNDNNIMYTSTINDMNRLPKKTKKDDSTDSRICSKQNSNNAIDCIIRIPDIDLEKTIYTGINRNKYLDEYGFVTAANDMKYSNGGNYIICGHASRLYGHSFNRIQEIQIGTEIEIESENIVDTYCVNNILFADQNNCSSYFNQTNNCDIITIVSCAKYISENSYIIVQAKKK